MKFLNVHFVSKLFMVFAMLFSVNVFSCIADFENVDLSKNIFNRDIIDNYTKASLNIEITGVLLSKNITKINQHEHTDSEFSVDGHSTDHECKCCDDCQCLNCLDCAAGVASSAMTLFQEESAQAFSSSVSSHYFQNYISYISPPLKHPPKTFS